MKKTAQTTIDEIRDHVLKNPSCTYRQVATLYGVSEITVKRACADLGRGKDWRRGRQQPPDDDKFWSAVDRSANSCWEWQGSLNNSGYGFVYFDGRNQGAHRVAYALTIGPIAEGLELDHACRNRACCNPDHLEPVTRAVNMERVRSAGAQNYEPDQPCSVDSPAESLENMPPSLPKYRPGYWSRTVQDPLEMGCREAVKLEEENRRWGLDFDQLGPRETWPRKVHMFTITGVSAADAIRVMLAARSAVNAREMFDSVWGYAGGSKYPYEIDVRETGQFADADSTAFSVSRWRDRLNKEYRAWESTTEGSRCIARLAAERDERLRAQDLEAEIDHILRQQWQLVQSELRKKAAAAKRSRPLCSRCLQRLCPRCGPPGGEGGKSRRKYDEFEMQEAYPDETYSEDWESCE
jgi:hypothetical protein